jgi:hypothetical protein
VRIVEIEAIQGCNINKKSSVSHGVSVFSSDNVLAPHRIFLAQGRASCIFAIFFMERLTPLLSSHVLALFAHLFTKNVVSELKS